MPEMTDVRCDDCGAVFPMIVGVADREEGHVWHPGKKCPICGSEKFFPVVRTDKREPKPLAKWKLDRRVGIAAGVVIVLFVIIGGAWYFRERPHRQAGLKAVYICDVCRKLFVRGVTGKVPKKCPECKNWQGYRALQCLNCYAVYAWKTMHSPGDPPPCPKCKSKYAKMIVQLSDIQKKREVPKEGEEGAKEGKADEEKEGVHAD